MARLEARVLAWTVAYTVAVFAATIAIQVYQPFTGGYLNLGEAVIYAAAITATPLVAAIAGGVGASLADVATGYAIFAPGTLVIKMVEGYLAGVLVRRLEGRGILGTGLACFLAGLWMVLGYFLYEYFVSNPLTGRPPVNAVMEVPGNIIQALAGVIVGVPVGYWLKRAGYTLR